MNTGNDYYNKRIATDERLTAALLSIQRRINAGERIGGRGKHSDNICVSEVLERYEVTTKWSPFVMGFDYSTKITQPRVASAREAYQRRELMRWTLAHQQEAMEQLGLQELPKPKPEREQEQAMPVVPEIKLDDWGLTSGMKALWLGWKVTDMTAEGGVLPYRTLHSLKPQSYRHEHYTTPGGEQLVRRTRLAGSFKNGKLTNEEAQRVLAEGRARLAEMFPGKVLEPQASTERQWDFLTRDV